MATHYTATLPPNWIIAKVRDQEWKGLQAGMPRPDVRQTNDAVTQITWSYLDDRTVDPAVVSAWQTAVANPTPPADAPWLIAEQQQTQIENALAGLRAYLGLTTPSAAQRLAMEKTLIRTVLNLVRVVRQDQGGVD